MCYYFRLSDPPSSLVGGVHTKASTVMTSIVTARINYWQKIPEGHVVFNIDVSSQKARRSDQILCERVQRETEKSERQLVAT